MAISNRRKPQQERSRKRIDKILSTAAMEISQNGFGALKMKKIAEDSDMSLGALYQYFSDKNDIVKALIDKHYNQLDLILTNDLAGAQTFEDLLKYFDQILDEYLSQYYKNELLLSIWFSTQMSRELSTADFERTVAAANILASKWIKLASNGNRQVVKTRCLLIMEYARATGRATVLVGSRQEANRLIRESKRIITNMLTDPF